MAKPRNSIRSIQNDDATRRELIEELREEFRSVNELQSQQTRELLTKAIEQLGEKLARSERNETEYEYTRKGSLLSNQVQPNSPLGHESGKTAAMTQRSQGLQAAKSKFIIQPKPTD